jgi:hypothetical protein
MEIKLFWYNAHLVLAVGKRVKDSLGCHIVCLLLSQVNLCVEAL